MLEKVLLFLSQFLPIVTGFASVSHTMGNLLVKPCISLVKHQYSKMKLDGSTLNSEIAIEGVLRLDRFRNSGGVAFFIKHTLAYSYKSNMCLNTKSILTEINLTKS